MQAALFAELLRLHAFGLLHWLARPGELPRALERLFFRRAERLFGFHVRAQMCRVGGGRLAPRTRFRRRVRRDCSLRSSARDPCATVRLPWPVPKQGCSEAGTGLVRRAAVPCIDRMHAAFDLLIHRVVRVRGLAWIVHGNGPCVVVLNVAVRYRVVERAADPGVGAM